MVILLLTLKLWAIGQFRKWLLTIVKFWSFFFKEQNSIYVMEEWFYSTQTQNMPSTQKEIENELNKLEIPLGHRNH